MIHQSGCLTPTGGRRYTLSSFRRRLKHNRLLYFPTLLSMIPTTAWGGRKERGEVWCTDDGSYSALVGETQDEDLGVGIVTYRFWKVLHRYIPYEKLLNSWLVIYYNTWDPPRTCTLGGIRSSSASNLLVAPC